MKSKFKKLVSLLTLFGFGLFSFASAHEVYILENGRMRIRNDNDSVSPFLALQGNWGSFIFWGTLQALFFIVLLILNYKGVLAQRSASVLKAIKPYAPVIARVFLGLSFLYGSFNQAIFGPEIALAELAVPSVLKAMLFVTGVMMIVGFIGRVAAAIAFVLFCVVWQKTGLYVFDYTNYLAEIILILVAGSGLFSLDSLISKVTDAQKTKFQIWGSAFEEKYGGLILRIGLGISMAWAAITVKFLHSNLPLEVISAHGLTKFFPFDPLFIVLGAGLVELCIAIMFLLGILIRATTIFFLTFIFLSLMFFGEAVWPHLILFGISLAILMYGYDDYTLWQRFIKWRKGQRAEDVF